MLTTIGLDADDTLWQNEAFFRLTQDHFVRLLADHATPIIWRNGWRQPNGETLGITVSA